MILDMSLPASRSRSAAWFLGWLSAVCFGCLLSRPAMADSPLSYEKDVRPILKTHCFQCHGEAGAREGGLDLRLRRLALQGGDSGPAVTPGDAAASLLLQRMQAGEMPPETVQHRPTAAELALLEAWIAGGAPALRDEPADLDPDHYLTEEERSYWAFLPILRPAVPVVDGQPRVRTAIDAFILEKLESHHLTLAPDADRATLLRRVYLNLLGLPPPPEEVDAFLTDTSPDAYERRLDRLLASPQYGERWGRHWLDVAGYADSEGFTDEDPLRPDAFKYRDYVIRAFNADKPLDRFIVEQLAGDELIGSKLTDLTLAEVESLVATGFLRMAPDGTAAAGVDQNVARNEVLAQTLQIVTSSLLGLTVGCAQCHDHRYDPISQADYYALRAVFEPAYDWKNWRTPAQRRVSLYTDADREQSKTIEAAAKQVEAQRAVKQQAFIDAVFQQELAKLPEELREPVRAARDTPEKERTAEQQQLVKAHPSVNVTAGSLYLYDKKAADELQKMADEAAKLRGTKPKEEFVRALWEPADRTPPQTFLFFRGDHEQPRQELAPAELAVLAQHEPCELPVDDPDLPSTGRRLAYARWLTQPKHPLPARVLANRIWLHHFGRGLVATPGDFGQLGSRPSHPDLLDWLASELIASDWSTKHLHRLIMTSSVYRQSSVPAATVDGPDPAEVDAENVWLSHYRVRRVDAETLRDCLLAVSGQANWRQFGPAVPVMADTVGQFVIGIENLNAGRPGPVIDMKGEQYRRSVYVQFRRSRPLSMLEPFDAPSMEPNCTVRSSTTVATQSLLLMNSEFLLERAEALAERARHEAGDELADQVRFAWRLVFASSPSETELSAACGFVTDQAGHFAEVAANTPVAKGSEPRDPRLDSLTSFCHAILSSNRFLYLD